MSNILFTIGHSNRPLYEFVALLKHYSITVLADVRSVPYSRRHPQFNREPLQETLRSHDIGYIFLGEELGARAKDRFCYVNGKAIYQKIAATQSFQDGLERVGSDVRKGRVFALMCAEKDPMMCHRSILICRNLRWEKFEIRHILDEETTETQGELEQRLIAHLKLQADLFVDADPDALIERAYDLQADRIAYVEKNETRPE